MAAHACLPVAAVPACVDARFGRPHTGLAFTPAVAAYDVRSPERRTCLFSLRKSCPTGIFQNAGKAIPAFSAILIRRVHTLSKFFTR